MVEAGGWKEIPEKQGQHPGRSAISQEVHADSPRFEGCRRFRVGDRIRRWRNRRDSKCEVREEHLASIETPDGLSQSDHGDEEPVP